jgi:DNA-binding transcriptional LysR family regulator
MPRRHEAKSSDLRHLRYIVAVAEEGSLTVAAERRYIRPSPR